MISHFMLEFRFLDFKYDKDLMMKNIIRVILGVLVVCGFAFGADDEPTDYLSNKDLKKYQHYMKRWTTLKKDNEDFYNGCRKDTVRKGCEERKEIVRRLIWLKYADDYGRAMANKLLSKKWKEWFELKWDTEGNDRNNVFVVLEQDLKLEEIRRGKTKEAQSVYKIDRSKLKKIPKKTKQTKNTENDDEDEEDK